MGKIVLRYGGIYSDYELKQYDQSVDKLIDSLNGLRPKIESLIQNELREEIPEIYEIHVSIEFRRGSLEWIGEVTFWLDWMARLGGAAAFVLMTKDAVKQAVDRILGLFGLSNPRTVVRIIYPRDIALFPYRRDNQLLFLLGGVAALTFFNTVLLLFLFAINSLEASHSEDVVMLPILVSAIMIIPLVLYLFWRRL